MKTLLLLSLLFIPQFGLAYIPSSKLILERVVKSNPSGPLTLEKDILIYNNNGQARLHEVWSIENEQNFKILVTGAHELKDKLAFLISYQNGTKTYSFLGEKKTERYSDDFFERLFLLKSLPQFASILGVAGVYPTNHLSLKNFKLDKETNKFNYIPEKNLSLSRSGGVVTWYFGLLSTADKKQPGLWVEQDQFVIKKMRLPSSAEMVVEKYSSLGKGQKLPRFMQINWSGQTAEISTVDYKVGVAKNFMGITEKSTEAFNGNPLRSVIEEFYLRFR